MCNRLKLSYPNTLNMKHLASYTCVPGQFIRRTLLFPLYWLPRTRDQKRLNFYWFTWWNVVNKLFLLKRNASPCMTFNQMRCPRVHYRCAHERVKTCSVCLGLICNLIFFSVLDVIRLWFETSNCTFLNY